MTIVRGYPLRDAPCNCMTPPFQCYAPNIGALPACNTDGVVYVVGSHPDYGVNFPVYCFGGQWWPLSLRSSLIASYNYTVTNSGGALLLPGTALNVPLDITLCQSAGISKGIVSGLTTITLQSQRDVWFVTVQCNFMQHTIAPTKGSMAAVCQTTPGLGQVGAQMNWYSVLVNAVHNPFPGIIGQEPFFRSTAQYCNVPANTQLVPMFFNGLDQNGVFLFFGVQVHGADLARKPI